MKITRSIGSIWRRWDVHVHTPGTLHADGFGTWEEFVAAVEKETGIAALGVTDYLGIAGYSRLKKEKDGGRLHNIPLIFPNIELRISPATKYAKGINLHLLISPDDPDHEQKVLDALSHLTFEYEGHGNYSCTPAQLRSLGKAFNPALSDGRAAFEEGAKQFKIEFRQLREWYRRQTWLANNTIIALDAGQKDGAAGLQHDDGFAAIREEIYRFADVILSGRTKDRDYWLGLSHDAECKQHGGPKACLHGCDAHDMQRLLKPDESRFCWIKADPTFEGLRQVLLEPEERVWIGETPPDLRDASKVIQSVRISGTKGWFEEEELKLNAGLVALIGRKGMGKSALNELIAYGSGSWKDDEQSSFISRARNHLKGSAIEITWADGRVSKTALSAKGSASGDDDVRYLSQRFVERLCADPRADSELVRAIESVVFNHLDVSDRLNASSFHDLRERKTAVVRSEQRRQIAEMKRLHREIDEGFARRRSLPERRGKLQLLGQNKEALIKQLPTFQSEAETKVAEEMGAVRKVLAETVARQAVAKEKMLRVSEVEQKIATFEVEIQRFLAELQADLDELGVTADDRQAYRVAFAGDTQAPLAAKRMDLQQQIDMLEGVGEPAPAGTIQASRARLKQLEMHVSEDASKRQRFTELQTQVNAIEQEAVRLTAEIAAIEGFEAGKLAALRGERHDAFGGYLATLKTEQALLADMYAPLARQFGSHPEERQVQFEILWKVDVEAWAERGMSLFDQRKSLPFASVDELKELAVETLLPLWKGEGTIDKGTAFDAFLAHFPGSGEEVASILRGSFGPMDFFDWLYSVDHIRLVYGLSYQGTPLEKLSPGTKGIVLLILYLAIDSEDRRPLLIDQPDENLDNESIFNLLASYFRRAKARRQILLITHNPNLVVNTDAEQIVVATCVKGEDGLPKITYASGAIENASPPDGIRQTVCRVLEGGEDAFQRREKRYAFGK